MTIIRNEFDERIEDPADIQSLTQFDDKYISTSGYFSDYLCGFRHLKSCCRGTLTRINNTDYMGDYIFICDNGIEYRYFIPESLVKQEKPKKKKYRAFSLEEFLKTFKIGDIVTFRKKDSNRVEHYMFTGYVSEAEVEHIAGMAKVTLGDNFGLGYLYINGYELFLNGKWQPFGIEVD